MVQCEFGASCSSRRCWRYFYFDKRGARERVVSFTASESKSNYRLIPRGLPRRTYIYTGWMKVSNLAQTAGFFATIGFAPFWTYLVSFVELLGGIVALLGIFTRIASGLLFIVMVVAVYVVHKDMTMVMTPLSLLFSTLALLLSGGGSYSIMNKLCGSENSQVI